MAIDETGENYAAHHGATIFGWQAHQKKCGGQPGASDEVIAERLDEQIAEKKKKFPDSDHYRILASEGGIDIQKK